ncbi:winged helix DNA-binding domain-containing protein [Kineosporia mesophila]|uniref:Winged helix DNA-binding domain-containing protein n=1 Tax=Kineosporia mesophila TaxID=566012 RepID=A0ABP7A679_9ACTN|nr:winged helix DNA-binding domain-containing protein [Kineosporia mesophila]MCD5351536.1 winged helix DNA-binding domain-containing protein [Kineosporia mesophila]
MTSPITARQLNRATLARQHLLARAPLTALQMIEHLVGMQSQDPQAAYGGLWARIENFDPHELSALIETRQAVRIMAMRSTIHLFSADDCRGLRPLMQPMLDRVCLPVRVRQAVGDVDELEQRTRELLSAGPLNATVLNRAVAAHYPDATVDQIGLAVRGHVPLVQVPPRALWGRGGQTTYVTAEDWLGAPLRAHDLKDVIRRYLGAFGPASVADVQAWCKLTRLREITDAMTDLVHLQDGLLDLPDAPRPPEDAPAPVRMLSEFDNLLLSHADRTRVVSDDDRQRMATLNGIVPATVLVDGRVAASWRLDRRQKLLTVTPFRRLPKRDLSAIEDEAHRAAGFQQPGSEVRMLPFDR